MNLEDQTLFFFSALGAFNGLFLSLYFAFFSKNRNRTTYFLAALLLVISVRVAKSVFMTFYPGISSAFIQVGLTACALIGPFIYLYISEAAGRHQRSKWRWLLHVAPVVAIMIVIGIYYPYKEYRWLWQREIDGYFCWPLFAQWLGYIIASGMLIKDHFKQVLTRGVKSTNQEVWLVNLVMAMAIIWVAYFTNGYTSYIVGALSFSFTFYISIFIWGFKKGKALTENTKTPRYIKKITEDQSGSLASKLSDLLDQQELYKNPELKLQDLAKALAVSPHFLSQYLNDNVGKSFTTLINERRIRAAAEMIKTSDHLTLEAIGNECGFKSNSSFYTAFKKFTGKTPASVRKALI